MTTRAAYFLSAAGFKYIGLSDDEKLDRWQRPATLELPAFTVEVDPAVKETHILMNAILHAFRNTLRDQNREALRHIIGPIPRI